MELYQEHSIKGFARSNEKKPPSVSNYIDKYNPKNNIPTAKKSKKNKSNSSNPNSHLDQEKKLDELSKVAQDNITLYDLAFQHQNFLQNSNPSINTANSSSDVSINSSYLDGTTNGSTSSYLDDNKYNNNRALSGTEAAFLLRQINSGDQGSKNLTSELSLFNNPDEFSSTFNTTNLKSVNRNLLSGLSGTTPMTGYRSSSTNNNFPLHSSNGNNNIIEQKILEEMIKALQEKVKSLEESNITLTENIKKKDDELNKKSDKLIQIQLELDQVRTTMKKEIKELKESHELEILKLNEKHSKEKSLFFSASKPSTANSSSSSSSSSSNHSSTVAPLESSKHLLDQISALKKELKETNEKYTNEKLLLNKESIEKNYSMEKTYKDEINKLKNHLLNKEEEIIKLNDTISIKELELKKIISSKNYYEKNNEKILLENNKLKNDLKSIQKTIQATTRFENSSSLSNTHNNNFNNTYQEDDKSLNNNNNSLSSSLAIPLQNTLQNYDLPSDVLMIIKQNDARNDAKIRQISNKLEFLKSQLDTERKITLETKNSLEESYQLMNQIKEEHSKRLKQFEEDKNNEIKEVERKVSEGYEKRMTELTILQRQIHQLNNRTNDLTTENLTYKQREESLEQQVNRLNAQVETYRSQIEDLKQKNNELIEKDLEEKSLKDTNKLNSDMILRRLDNERHYLKSQLTSEITLKNEIQTILQDTEERLKQTQVQWQKDVDALKEKVDDLKQKLEQVEQEKKHNEIVSKETIERLEIQKNELKDTIVSYREQIRLEQLNLESVQLDKLRLTENINSLNNEIILLKENSKKNDEQNELQIKNLNNLLNETIENSNKQINNYKNELTIQCSINSKAQGELIKSKEITAEAVKEAMKLNQANRIFIRLKEWRRNRLRESFKKWSTSNLLQNIAIQFKKQVENIVEETRKEEDLIKKEEIETLKKEHEKDILLKQEQTRMECKRLELEALQLKEIDHKKILEDHEDKKEKELKQLEEDMLYDIEQLKQQHNIEVSNLKEFNKRHSEDLALELKNKLAEARANLEEELINEFNKSKQKFKVEYEHKIEELKLENETKLECLEMELKEKKEMELKKKQDEFNIVLKAIESDYEKKLKNEREKLIEEHNNEMNSKYKNLTDEHNEFIGKLKQDHENQINDLKNNYEENLKNKLQEQAEFLTNKYEKQMNDSKEALLSQFNEEKQSLISKKDSENEAKIKAEMKKWKQVLASNDDRLELELNKYRTELELEYEKKLQKKEDDKKYEIEILLNKQKEEFKIERELALLALEEEKEKFLSGLESNQQQRIQAEVGLACKNLTEELTFKAKQELDQLIAKHATEKEKDRQKLEEVKREFQLQLRTHSEDRSRMVRQQQQNEEKNRDKIKSLKASHSQAIANLQKEKLIETTKLEEEKKNLNEKYLHEIDDLKLKHEVDLETNIARVIKEEEEKHKEKYTKEIEEMKNEYEKLLSQLEDGLNHLKEEKMSLFNDVNELKHKLEESEDTLYDTKQEHKKIEKEMSLKIWKLTAKFLILNEKNKQINKELEENHNFKLEKISSHLQGYLYDVVYNYLKSSIYFNEIEEIRSKILLTLTSYRVDDLKKYKKLIQELEIELDQYQNEKDLLEDQRYKCQHEINFLTKEIKEQEEAMRLLQGESSMTIDGRVNIAYARKKKRIDLEIERILEQVEEKRTLIVQLDERIHEKTKKRDDKENELVDIERQLVTLLVEQQKQALKDLYGLTGYLDKAKLLVASVKLPWVNKTEDVEVKEISRILAPIITPMIDL